ncbi:hypothetical protein DA2_0883 [Desulfovibrio sp. A2]|nr:hypothetical protein DA2_0883 [Desulfovibrio sp. A2]
MHAAKNVTHEDMTPPYAAPNAACSACLTESARKAEFAMPIAVQHTKAGLRYL